MSEDLHRRVVTFLATEFARKEGRQCVRLELSSAQPGLRGDVLRTWDRHEDPELFAQLARTEELATTVLRIAEDHADSFGSGQHRFELRTEQHLGGRQKLSFRILAGASGDSDVNGSGEDAPTAMGMVAQQMRHNEVHMRMSAQMYQTTLGVMQRQINDLNEENAKLRRDRVEHLSELEVAQSKRDERDLAAMIQVAADRRKDLAFGKLMQLAPVFAGRLLGNGKGPEAGAPTPLAILVNELARSLTPEQVAHIASSLSPNQQILFVEAMRAAEQAKPAEPEQQPAPATAASA
jgi:hypothetical protein